MLITVACTLFGCYSQQEQTGDQHTGDSLGPSFVGAQDGRQEHIYPEEGSLEFRLVEAGLVDIKSINQEVVVDLKYSTTENFVGVDVYGELESCYLQPEVAKMLASAQKELTRREPGFRLLLYDCARPLSVQQILWDTLQKPDDIKHLYVADPREGSIHNFGSAVDLTIANEHGQPLDMGTGYDYFGELAYPSKEEELLSSGDLKEEQVRNRQLLRQVMASAGFTPITSEWWHFNAYSRERAKELFEIIE